MPKFPRKMDTNASKDMEAAKAAIAEEVREAKKKGEVTPPMSKADFIEFNGEKLYPSFYKEGEGHILVFSATKPAPDKKVEVPHLILHANKLHWWCAGDKLFLSEERPAHSVVVDELRKAIAKQVVSTFRSAPNAKELEKIDALLPLVIEKVGPEVEEIAPELLQTMVKELVKNYKSHPNKGFSVQAVEAAKQVMSFDNVWKTIKSTCEIRPNDYVELMKRDNSAEFIHSFQTLLGGGRISRAVLFSNDFAEAMKLHVNDPESSKMLLDALKRHKAYDPAKICQAYVSCMTAIEGSRQFFPNTSADEKKATALRIEQFISQASAKIQHNDINNRLLSGLGALIIPDSDFITSPKKVNTTEFAKKFEKTFPELNRAFRHIIKEQHQKELQSKTGELMEKQVDKYLQTMVNDLNNKLGKEAKQHNERYNAYHEFSVYNNAAKPTQLAASEITFKPNSEVTNFKIATNKEIQIGSELLLRHKVIKARVDTSKPVAEVGERSHEASPARNMGNMWGLLKPKNPMGLPDMEKDKDEVKKKVDAKNAAKAKPMKPEEEISAGDAPALAAPKQKAESTPKPKGAKDYIEINGEKLYPQMLDSNLVFYAIKPVLPLKIDLSKVKIRVMKSHWYFNGQEVFYTEEPREGEGLPNGSVIVDKLRDNIARQVTSSFFHSKPNADELRMISSLIPMMLAVDQTVEMEKLSPELLETVTKNLVKDYKSNKSMLFAEKAIEGAKQVMRFDGVWKAIKSTCEIHPNDYVELNKRYNRMVGEFEIKNNTSLQGGSIEAFLTGFRDASGGTIPRKLLFSNEFNEAMKMHINDPENSKKLLENLTRNRANAPAKLCSAYVSCMRLIQEYRQIRPKETDLDKTQDRIDTFIMTAGNALQHNAFDNTLLNQFREQIIPDTAFLTSPKKVNAKDFAEAFQKNFPELYRTFNEVIKDNPLVDNIEKRNHKKVGLTSEERLKNMVVDISSKLQKVAPKSKTAFNAYSDFVTLESEEKTHAKERAPAAAPAKGVDVSPAVSNLLRAQGYLDKKAAISIERMEAKPKENSAEPESTSLGHKLKAKMFGKRNQKTKADFDVTQR